MSVAGSRAGNETGTSNKVDYKFCSECSNLLYPREDRQLNKLLYVCKACSSVQESEPACIFRAQLSSNVQETAGVVQNVANDPTLPHIRARCPRCSEDDAVFFQSQQRKGDTAMKLYYVCTNCNHLFNDPNITH